MVTRLFGALGAVCGGAAGDWVAGDWVAGVGTTGGLLKVGGGTAGAAVDVADAEDWGADVWGGIAGDDRTDALD